MATPIYSYPSGGNFSGALTGAMTALGGGLQEIDAAESAKKRFQVMSNELGARGLTSDAAIYQSIADDTTPNFLTAAITGKPTDHNINNLTDHALKILESDREMLVKAATSRDSTLVPSLSILKSNITSNETAIGILERQNAELDQKLANPGGYKYKGQEQGDQALRAKNAAEIARLKAENDQFRLAGAGMIQDSKNRRAVPGGGWASNRSAEQNPPVTPLPAGASAADVGNLGNIDPNGNFGQKTPNSGATPLIPFDENGNPIIPDVPPTAPQVRKATYADVPGTTVPNVPATPLEEKKTNQIYNILNPTDLSGQLSMMPKPSRPAASSVTAPNRPPTADELIDSDIADYHKAGGKENPRNRDQLAAAWGRFKQPIDGDAVFNSKEAADAYVAKNSGMNASIRPLPNGQLAVTLSTPSASKKSGEPNVYFVDPQDHFAYVKTKLPNSNAWGYMTPKGEIVTADKMSEIIKTVNRTRQKGKEIFPVVDAEPPSPVSGPIPDTATSANPAGGQSTGTGADYSPQTWKANQQK